MKRRIIYPALLYCAICLFSMPLSAQLTNQHNTVFVEWGNWQPHSLNDVPRFSGFGAAGATAYIGTGVLFNVFKDVGIGITAGYWALKDLDREESVHSLVVHPVTVTVKHWLIPGNFMAAFVIYNAGVYWGVENETSPLGRKLSQAISSFGLGLGAGIDIAFTRKFGIGACFKYNYIQFPHPLGGVTDFSGPCISIAGYYYF